MGVGSVPQAGRRKRYQGPLPVAPRTGRGSTFGYGVSGCITGGYAPLQPSVQFPSGARSWVQREALDGW